MLVGFLCRHTLSMPPQSTPCPTTSTSIPFLSHPSTQTLLLRSGHVTRSAVVQQAAIRPLSAGVKVSVEDGQFITFTLNRPRDLMLQVNDDKWQALHLLVNPLTSQRQRATLSMSGILGPGLNNGSAYAHVKDGDLYVPSGKTLYLAGVAFLNARIRIMDAKDVTIRGHGFIFEPRRALF